jgi:hypothetical protein
VYTVSGLIDQFKNGGRGRFVGIKEIDDNDCENTINKFPVNEGFRNFDFLYFLFSILFTVIQYIGVPFIIIFSLVAFLVNNVLKNKVLRNLPPWAILLLPFRKVEKVGTIKLPMITWPDCQACDCGSTQPETLNYSESVLVPDSGLLTQVSNPELYTTKLSQQFANSNWVNTIPLAIATNNLDPSNPLSFKCAKGAVPLYSSIQKQTIPIGERINIFNLKTKYFEGTNKIKVTFASENNLTHHYDNTLTVLATQSFSAGTLLSFVNPDSTTDSNYLWSATTTAGSTVSGINEIGRASCRERV